MSDGFLKPFNDIELTPDWNVAIWGLLIEDGIGYNKPKSWFTIEGKYSESVSFSRRDVKVEYLRDEREDISWYEGFSSRSLSTEELPSAEVLDRVLEP